MNANFSRQLVFFLERFGFRSGVKRLLGWRLENDTIKGQFVGEVAGRLQAFNFSIGNEGLKYGIVNNQKSDSYLEGLFLASTKVQIKANSAYNQGKLAVLTRLDKKPDCQVGFSCGDSCINRRKECEIRHPQAKQASQQMLKIARSEGSGIFSINPMAYKEVNSAENKLRFNDFETGVVVDSQTGKKLLEKKGTKLSVPLTMDDVKLMKNNIMTHNHPWLPENTPYPYSKGISFSEADVRVACFSQMAEIRACTSHFNHSLKPPKTGWSQDFYNKTVSPSIEKHKKDIFNEFNFKVRTSLNPQLTAQKAQVELNHALWERVAKETGMIYKRENVPISKSKEKEMFQERLEMLGEREKNVAKINALTNLVIIGIAGAFLLKKYYKNEENSKKTVSQSKSRPKKDSLEKKPKCETGIACGNSCVSSKKECESSSSEVKGFSRGMVQLARNTTSGVSAIASAEIQKAENRIRNNPSESAVVVDARTGKTLVDRQGYKTGVFFTRDDISHFKGNVMTHNHPWLPNDGVTNKGISFSQEDIFAACGTQMAEMRACTSFYNHSMKPPKEGWDENFFNTKVKPSFEKHEKEVIKEFVAKIRNVSNPMEIQKAAQLAETERFHLTWERVAKETGMIYSRTKIPNVNEDQIIRERQNEINQEQQSAQRRKKLLQLAILGIASAFLLKNHYKQKGVQQ